MPQPVRPAPRAPHPGTTCTPSLAPPLRVPVAQPSFRSAPWPATSTPCLRALPGLLRGGPGRPRHSTLTPPARGHDPGVAGPAGQARGASTDTGRPAACAPADELGDVAAAFPAPG